MVLIIDRFEDKYAICEDENGNMVNLLIDDIVGKVKEGDVLTLKEGKYVVDIDKTANRTNYIKEITCNLWEN